MGIFCFLSSVVILLLAAYGGYMIYKALRAGKE